MMFMTDVYPYEASWCLRVTVASFNVLISISGLALVGLGKEINDHLAIYFSLPKLWLIGVIPSILGISGALTVLINKRKWAEVGRLKKTRDGLKAIEMLTWLALASASTTLSYVYFSVSGHLRPELYRVNIHVYSSCRHTPAICQCTWQLADPSGALPLSSCQSLRYTTTLYLCVLCVLITCLLLLLITLTLTFTVCFCLHRCIPKDRKELFANSVQAFRMKPMRRMDSLCLSNTYILMEKDRCSDEHMML